VESTAAAPRTAKGARQSQEIIAATLRCLARDGYAATTIQRIADEAGVRKQTVLYYFAPREALFDRASRDVAGRLLSGFETAVQDIPPGPDMLADAFDRIWLAATRDRALQIAWLGVHAEAMTDPLLRATTAGLSARYQATVGDLLDRLEAAGWHLTVAREGLEVTFMAGFQGLLIQTIESGPTPAIEAALGHWRHWLRSLAIAPG
jgi:AcrR family transcriptional regulator